MSTRLDVLDALRRDLFARLDAELGARTWTTPLGELTGGWGGESGAVLPLYEAALPYDESSWPRVTEIVVQTGIEHGFGDVRVLQADPSDSCSPDAILRGRATGSALQFRLNGGICSDTLKPWLSRTF